MGEQSKELSPALTLSFLGYTRPSQIVSLTQFDVRVQLPGQGSLCIDNDLPYLLQMQKGKGNVRSQRNENILNFVEICRIVTRLISVVAHRCLF